MEVSFDEDGFLVMDDFPDEDVQDDEVIPGLFAPPPPLDSDHWESAVQAAVAAPVDVDVGGDPDVGFDTVDDGWDAGDQHGPADWLGGWSPLPDAEQHSADESDPDTVIPDDHGPPWDL